MSLSIRERCLDFFHNLLIVIFCLNYLFMSEYRCLFIDLDNTLFDFKKASREAFRETYELLEYERFFDSFDTYMHIYEPRNRELWSLYDAGKIDKSQLNRLRFNYPLEVVGHKDEYLGVQFATEALKRIPYKNMPMQGALEVVEYLYAKYDLYILSNGFRELQSKKMATIGIAKYFKKIILSEDIGVNKPDKKLFDYALKITGADKNESLMIGDAFETDIVGAVNAGIDQMFLNTTEDCGTLPFRPTYEVKNLFQIKNIL